MPRLPSALFSALLALGVSLPTLALAQAGGAAPAPAPGASAPAATPPAATAGDKVVARVNGSPITERDVAIAAEDPALAGMSEAQKRDLIVGYLIDLKLGANAAEAAKIGDDPDFMRKMNYFRQKVLLDEYLEREVKKAATPEAARKLYDETTKAMKPEEEVHARHILVESEDEAKAVEARLKAGEDFAKVAAEMSKDPGSKADGGDLGFFTKERMVQPFADTAFKLQPGQVSEPVKSQFGWHVIKVEEKRTKPVPGFEEMREQVETYLTRKTQQDIVLGLRKDAKIERFDEPAKPADPKPADSKPADAATPAEPKKP